MSFRNLLVSAAMLLLASLVILAQETPRELRDLVGIRASSGEGELQNRGYSFVKTEEAGDRKYSYWWNESRRTCVSIATYNGRYEAVVKSMPFDCGRSSDSGGNNNDGRQSVTVFADRNFRGTSQSFGPGRYLAMGNQLGALRNDAASSVVVNRGFRVRLCESEGSSGGGEGRCEEYGEGKFNLRYDNKASYIEVTRVGGGGGGADRPVNVSDLVGARASSGESQMRSRGFRYVDGFDSGNTKYSIWWRSRSRQCIQVATANGRYDSLTDIGSHPRCR